MFIRRARTLKATGEAYFSHRLVASVRTGKQVLPPPLLNLGRHFDLAQPRRPASVRPHRGVAGRTTRPARRDQTHRGRLPRYAARLRPTIPRPARQSTGTDPPGIGEGRRAAVGVWTERR